MAELRSEVIVAPGKPWVPGSKAPSAVAALLALSLAALTPPPSQAQPCTSSGTFGAPTATLLPSSPIFSPVVADMNRDGRLDLVVSGPTMVRVLLGNGTTSTTPFPTIIPSVNVGSTPRGLAVADLDGDGFLDVAVAVQGALQLAVLWGDGTGALSSISGLGTPTAPMSVALGDVDDDGDTDIAVAADDRIVIRRKGAGRTYPLITTINLAAGLQFVVSGDFDRDGNVDFAVTNSTTNNVYVLLGDGAAGFTQPPGSPFPAGAGARGLVTADFNRDGIPDLATQSNASNTIIVLLGAGAGVFAAPTAFPVGSGPDFLTVADFNRDGNPDIVSNGAANDVFLLLGDGAGGFASALIFPAGGGTLAPAAGDFDGDGRPDLAVAEPPATQVVVLPNQFGLGCPKASFARVGRFASNPSGNPEAVAVGDLNGDNRLDAVTAGDSTVGVFFGDGKGSVAGLTPLALDFGADARGVALGDLNSDGRLDIVATAPGTGEIQVFLNTGGGTFSPRTDFIMGSGTWAVALADLNGDGKLDVVVANQGAGNNIAVRLGNGAGGFSAATTFTAGPVPRALALGDIDGDLELDAVVALNGASQVAVLRGLGGGTFGPPTTLAVGAGPTGVALADLDGDLDLDLAVCNSGSSTITLRFGDGAGGFSAPTTLATGSFPEAIAALDLNADGKLDLATANSATASSDVTIRLGTGGGAFGPLARVEGFETPRALAFGDFNRDLKTDLAVPDWPISLNGLVIVPGDGAGGFGNLETAAGTSNLPDFAVGDLDGDGKPDLVSLDNGSTSLRVEKGNGDGTFTLSSSRAVPANSSGVVVADFNEDGKPDAVVGLPSNSVGVLLGDGAGGLGLPTTFPVAGASGPAPVAVMDFNRDGNLDLVTANSFSNSVSVLPGNGLGGFGAATNTSVGTNPYAVAVGDFNRDGRADLAVTNFNSNTVSILLDNGGGGFNAASVVVAGNPLGVVAADLDRNGTLDLAVTTFGGTVTTLTGNGAGGFTPNTPIAVGTGADGIAAVDVNRDGVLDLAVAKRDDNRVAVLLGLTAGGFGPPDNFTVRRRFVSRLVAADFDRDGKSDLAVSEYLFAPGAVSIVLNTNCDVRYLDLSQDVSTCHAPGSPFPSQPAVRVVDDGDNPIQCDVGPVTASIVPGSGTGGAVLGGTPAQTPSAGNALFSDLSINLPGRGYQLQFDHPALVATRSRTFTQGLAVSITGPPLLCEGQSASYTAGLGYDIYNWTLDGPSISMATSVVLSGLSAGLHTLAVSVTQDTCGSSDTLGINVVANLGAVTIGTAGPTSFCTSCLGGIVTEAHGGDGGTLAYQWGFRTASLGSITAIPGQTSPTYAMSGPDFPGPGTYYVVLTLSPTCGPPSVSNEIQVTVTVPPDEVSFFTVTSENLKNTLQWVNSTASGNVRIRFNPGPVTCTFPTADDGSDGSTLLANVSGTAGAYGTFVHDSLSDPLIANDTHYCFTLWVDLGGSFSAGRNNRGRPFSTSGPEKWAFNLGSMSLAPPGNGSGVVHVVGMDNSVHAVLKGVGGGTWPTSPAWIPRLMNGPSQGRPSGVPVTVGTANPVLFLGSQDGHVYAFDAKTGAPAWSPSSPPLGNIVQAGPSGIFSAFGGGGLDYVLVGTRDGGMANEFYALNPSDGTIAWSYDGDDGVTNHGLIGIISGQAAVDYVAKRVYFASRAFGPAPNNNTLWCLDLVTRTACWARPHGDIDSGVSLRGDRIYVGTPAGSVLAVNASDGTLGWTFTPAAPDGPVKGYVAADWQTDDLYFATSTRVWSLSDTGPTTFSHNWLTTGVPYANASTPVYAPGDPWVYVGGDGKLSRLSVLDGSETSFFPIGDGSARVGSPTIDLQNNFAYVATHVGVVYAIRLP